VVSQNRDQNRSMRGSFPGGPSVDGRELDERRLRSGEEAERLRDASLLDQRKRRRRRALLIAGAVGVVGAILGGVWIGGVGAPERLAESPEVRASSIEDILMNERSRILAELWRMESLEGTGR